MKSAYLESVKEGMSEISIKLKSRNSENISCLPLPTFTGSMYDEIHDEQTNESVYVLFKNGSVIKRTETLSQAINSDFVEEFFRTCPVV